MIDVIKQTPFEYSRQSRDYQVIARLYTALYNINKMYIDNMNVWNFNIDNKLTTLRTRTLNFIPKHSWDLDELDAAISCFKYLMRRKGTILALEFCLTILLRINNLSGEIDEESGTLVVDSENSTILIKIPKALASAGVVDDLLDYLLPAGFIYRIIEYSEIGIDNNNVDIVLDNIKEIVKVPTENVVIYGSPEYEGSNQLNGFAGDTIYKNNVPEVGDAISEI